MSAPTREGSSMEVIEKAIAATAELLPDDYGKALSDVKNINRHASQNLAILSGREKEDRLLTPIVDGVVRQAFTKKYGTEMTEIQVKTMHKHLRQAQIDKKHLSADELIEQALPSFQQLTGNLTLEESIEDYFRVRHALKRSVSGLTDDAFRGLYYEVFGPTITEKDAPKIAKKIDAKEKMYARIVKEPATISL